MGEVSVVGFLVLTQKPVSPEQLGSRLSVSSRRSREVLSNPPEERRRTEITFRNDFIELGTEHDGCIAVLPETLIGLEIRKVVP